MMATCLTLLAASSIKTDCDASTLSVPCEASRPGTAAFKLSSHFIFDQGQNTGKTFPGIDKAGPMQMRSDGMELKLGLWGC
jgi:hypothetical protein